MMLRAKHDNRGKNISAIISNNSLWRKKHIYFFPQEFNNEELEIIEEKVQKVFGILEGQRFEKKVGDIFIWIKKRRGKTTIRLVNQLDYSCDDIVYDIINMYKDIKKYIIVKSLIFNEKKLRKVFFSKNMGMAFNIEFKFIGGIHDLE
ncbi:hypothetical protein JHL18_12870 [Clostridium sp. YIM B02505]|uniref:Uncharacterized protein n=2 Tax=Clostridium yunnanense TaxID=2800325 RepID=A0ABS1EQB0_9CLOT|nr:hypothetical protein [Clostridium yunnanense]